MSTTTTTAMTETSLHFFPLARQSSNSNSSLSMPMATQRSLHARGSAPTYPSPIFDPYARFPADSTQAGRVIHQPLSQPLTPPSTDSQSNDDPYRMTRIQRQTPQSSVEVHVSLPSAGSEKDIEAEAEMRLHTKSSRGSPSIGESYVDDDFDDIDHDGGREASIK